MAAYDSSMFHILPTGYVNVPGAGLDLRLKGIWVADPSLQYIVVQQAIPALLFAQVSHNIPSSSHDFEGK
jgi:hypothetical protein